LRYYHSPGSVPTFQQYRLQYRSYYRLQARTSTSAPLAPTLFCTSSRTSTAYTLTLLTLQFPVQCPSMPTPVSNRKHNKSSTPQRKSLPRKTASRMTKKSKASDPSQTTLPFACASAPPPVTHPAPSPAQQNLAPQVISPPFTSPSVPTATKPYTVSQPDHQNPPLLKSPTASASPAVTNPYAKKPASDS